MESFALHHLRWQLYRCQPGMSVLPSDISKQSPVWTGSATDLTVSKLTETDNPDESDWWLVTCIQCPFEGGIQFEEIHGTAHAWVDDLKVSTFNNAFHPWRIDFEPGTQQVVLSLHFPSVASQTTTGRAPWRTGLVRYQQLREQRVVLLGRIPGWSGTGAVIGVRGNIKAVDRIPAPSVFVRQQYDASGSWLVVQVQHSQQVEYLSVVFAGSPYSAEFRRVDSGKWQSTLTLPCAGLERWFPHTHGSPTLHTLEVKADQRLISTLNIGLRDIVFSDEDSRFSINNERIFCRGACWIAPSVLEHSAGTLESRLEQVRIAGFNCLRVVGTSGYESGDFYDICDRLGILVWQDLPFASMAYPDNEAFRQEIRRELEWQGSRIAHHPSLMMVCGNSDVYQQSTLLGLPEPKRLQPLFSDHLRRWCSELFPDVPYLEGAPSIGPLPTHLSNGVCSYYGVGAYRRPLDDRSIEMVRFASECLGFANVPGPQSLKALFGTTTPSPVSPEWKRGVPRDASTGWDFDDVRDHYTEALFGEQTRDLRFSDLTRYFELSRLSSGIAMATTMARWRTEASACGGALIWMLHDLAPGAGWGLIDTLGQKKPAFHILKTVLAPVQVLVTDENFDGHFVHLINETSVQISGTLTLLPILTDGRAGRRVNIEVTLGSRSNVRMSVDAAFDRFQDSTWAHRFGPMAITAMAAVFTFGNGRSVDHVCPVKHLVAVSSSECLLEAGIHPNQQGSLVTLTSDRLLQWTYLSSEDITFEDNYVNFIPGFPKEIAFRPRSKATTIERLALKPANVDREIILKDIGES